MDAIEREKAEQRLALKLFAVFVAAAILVHVAGTYFARPSVHHETAPTAVNGPAAHE